MNIVALKTFLAIVELGNLNKAAERLFVTQSTVSARIDVLEETLGQTLLLRSRRGARLTKAGFAFMRYAENIVQTWDQGSRAVQLPEQFSGAISISCEHDLWEGNVEPWLEQLAQEEPNLAIEIWPGDRIESINWLTSGLIDLAITREPIAGDQINTRLFAKQQLLHVCSPNSNNNTKFITVDHGPGFRRQYSQQQQVSRITFGKGGNRWALDKILTGNYSGYLPITMVQPYLSTGQLQQVEGAANYNTECHLSWRVTSEDDHPWLANNYL